MELHLRALRYAKSVSVEIDANPFDGGEDGSVWSTDRPSVVKVFFRRENFSHELECYRRLLDSGVNHKIREFNVPRYLGSSEEFMAIEMTIVTPPYILDFGKAYLNDPNWPAHVLEDWNERMLEFWGDDVRRVKLALAALRRFGIWYYDAKPGNVMLKNWNPEIGD